MASLRNLCDRQGRGSGRHLETRVCCSGGRFGVHSALGKSWICLVEHVWMEKLEDLYQSPGHQHRRRSLKRRASQGKVTRDSAKVSGTLRGGMGRDSLRQKDSRVGGKSSCDGGGVRDRR